MQAVKNHLFSLVFIIACATGYLFDVLVFDKHLSAFDFVLQKPSWAVEFGRLTAENDMLSDSPTAHYPYKKEFWEATKQGYNAQYQPHIFSGKPTSGQGVGIFSTSLFQFFMDIPNALDFSTWFRLILAGVFMYMLLIQLGLGRAAACLGAVAWSYNMHQIAWLLFPQHLATQLWLPLLLGMNIYLLKNRTNIPAVLGLMLTVVFFYTSGYTQIVLYSFVFLGVFNTLYILIAQQQPVKEKIKNWLAVHAVYLTVGALLLPDALWQTQEIQEGLRGTQDFRYSKHRLDLSISALIQLLKDFFPHGIEVVRFLMPNYHAELGQIPPIRNIFSSNVVELQVYFGLLCLYLTVYGLLRGIAAKNRLLIVLGIMLLLCIALFNGNSTVISLMNLIPFAGSGSYRRIITLLLFTAIIIASFGARDLVDDLRHNRYVVMMLALILMLSWLAGGKLANRATLDVYEFIPWMGYLVVFLVLALILSRIGREKLIIPIAVALTLAELVITGYRFNTRMDAHMHFPENTVIQQIRSAPGDFRTALLMDHTGYHHNVLSYYDLSTLGGYETTAPNDYLYFMQHAFQKIHLTLNGILFLFDGNLDVLRLLNTKFIVSNLNLNSNLITEIYKNNAESLYRFKNPLQRVYCASDQIVNPDVNAIPAQLAELAKQLDRPVIVERAIVQTESLAENCRVSGLKVYTSKLSFDVDSDRATLVFIPINFHQYWTATVNDEKSVVNRANFSFMVIKIEPGTSHIVLEFINTKLTIAAVLMILLGLICIVIGLSRVQPAWQKLIFVFCGVLLIGKHLMSIPGIMNTDIPERPEIQVNHQDPQVLDTGSTE